MALPDFYKVVSIRSQYNKNVTRLTTQACNNIVISISIYRYYIDIEKISIRCLALSTFRTTGLSSHTNISVQ